MSNARRRTMRCAAAMFTLMLAFPGARSGCPIAAAGPCVLTLRGPGSPNVAAACLTEPWTRFLSFTLPERTPDLNRDGYREAVLKLSLPPAGGCRTLQIVVTFDALPSKHALDIGDSPTVDGYGGDAGSSGNCAEVHLIDRELRVMSRTLPPSFDTVDRLLSQTLALTAGSALEIAIADQRVEIAVRQRGEKSAGLRSVIDTATSQHLFALAGEPDPRIPGDPRRVDYDLYAAFNRVVHDRHGAPAGARYGRGVAKVEIRLTP